MQFISIKLTQVATIMIILCHLCQFYGNELHCWFDVGVQIFLCMSGYLFGKKVSPEIDGFDFYKKRFVKILVDYYVTILLAMVLELLFVPSSVSAKGMMGAILLYRQMEGGGHLWYIPYILLCYLLTPFLVRFFSRFQKESSLFFSIVIALLVSNYVDYAFFNYFNPAWINCYLIGLFLGFCEEKGRLQLFRLMERLLFLGCLILNPLQIYLQYRLHRDMNGGFLFYLIKTNAHMLLGCTLFLGMQWVFHFWKMDRMHRVLDLVDQYSYDIYLTHHFLIIGPLSLMEVTDSPVVNILLVLLLTGIFSVVVHGMAVWLKKGFHKFQFG